MNYAARPAKQVIRRLLVEACRKLARLTPLVNYQYVGFGGIEFIDFDLVHRELGLVKLVSVEGKPALQARADFNLPFAGLDLYQDTFGQTMTHIDWAQPTIVWLDYECALGPEAIADVSFLCNELQPGSVMAVTLNARSPKDGTRREALAAQVTESRVPPQADEVTLGGWGYAEAQRDVLLGVIDDEFGKRRDGARFDQLFDFGYRDGMPMQTVGGIAVSPANEHAVADLHFTDLDFTRRRGEQMLVVRVPPVTAKEAIHLNRQLPLVAGEKLASPGIAAEELQAYEHFYRWYPN